MPNDIKVGDKFLCIGGSRYHNDGLICEVLEINEGFVMFSGPRNKEFEIVIEMVKQDFRKLTKLEKALT